MGFKSIFAASALCIASAGSVMAADAEGLVRLKSAHGVKETLDRLEAALKDKGVGIVARVDHADSAAKVGLQLRPTALLIFGNPKAGTPLMQCAQTIGIDLPQRALAWQDEKGEVWLAYNDPAALAKRHGADGCEPAVTANAGALGNFAKAATAP